MAGSARCSATDSNPAMRPRPATVPAAAARSASAERRALQQRLGVVDQHERGVGQAHPSPRALQQRHAGLALEHRELLRDGRGRELKRVRDGGDRPAVVQLAQQAQSPELEHREGTLPIIARNRNRY